MKQIIIPVGSRNVQVVVDNDQELLVIISGDCECRNEDPAKIMERQLISRDLEMCLRLLEKTYKASGKQAADVIRLHYGLGGKDPMIIKDIAKLWGLSRERVRQIEDRALFWLRRCAAKLGMIEKLRMSDRTDLTPPWAVKK